MGHDAAYVGRRPYVVLARSSSGHKVALARFPTRELAVAFAEGVSRQGRHAYVRLDPRLEHDRPINAAAAR